MKKLKILAVCVLTICFVLTFISCDDGITLDENYTGTADASTSDVGNNEDGNTEAGNTEAGNTESENTQTSTGGEENKNNNKWTYGGADTTSGFGALIPAT